MYGQQSLLYLPKKNRRAFLYSYSGNLLLLCSYISPVLREAAVGCLLLDKKKKNLLLGMTYPYSLILVGSPMAPGCIDNVSGDLCCAWY